MSASSSSAFKRCHKCNKTRPHDHQFSFLDRGVYVPEPYQHLKGWECMKFGVDEEIHETFYLSCPDCGQRFTVIHNWSEFNDTGLAFNWGIDIKWDAPYPQCNKCKWTRPCDRFDFLKRKRGAFIPKSYKHLKGWGNLKLEVSDHIHDKFDLTCPDCGQRFSVVHDRDQSRDTDRPSNWGIDVRWDESLSSTRKQAKPVSLSSLQPSPPLSKPEILTKNFRQDYLTWWIAQDQSKSLRLDMDPQDNLIITVYEGMGGFVHLDHLQAKWEPRYDDVESSLDELTVSDEVGGEASIYKLDFAFDNSSSAGPEDRRFMPVTPKMKLADLVLIPTIIPTWYSLWTREVQDSVDPQCEWAYPLTPYCVATDKEALTLDRDIAVDRSG